MSSLSICAYSKLFRLVLFISSYIGMSAVSVSAQKPRAQNMARG